MENRGAARGGGEIKRSARTRAQAADHPGESRIADPSGPLPSALRENANQTGAVAYEQRLAGPRQIPGADQSMRHQHLALTAGRNLPQTSVREAGNEHSIIGRDHQVVEARFQRRETGLLPALQIDPGYLSGVRLEHHQRAAVVELDRWRRMQSADKPLALAAVKRHTPD